MDSITSPRRILVTGATGTLGRHAVAQVAARPGLVCRALRRSAPPTSLEPTGTPVEWRRADLLTDPLGPLLEGVEAVIHLASGKGDGDGDVAATGRLLEASRAAGVRHLVVISIIGCDRIPLPFYASKMRIEALLEAGGVPWSIVRVAQFHSFVARLVAIPDGLAIPSPIVGDLQFQPIDEAEAAEFLVDIALDHPLGRAPELAGPEVLTLAQATERWLAASGRPAKLVAVPLSSVAAAGHVQALAPWTLDVLAGYQAGLNTPHGERRLGRVTFAEWLGRQEA